MMNFSVGAGRASASRALSFVRVKSITFRWKIKLYPGLYNGARNEPLCRSRFSIPGVLSTQRTPGIPGVLGTLGTFGTFSVLSNLQRPQCFQYPATVCSTVCA